MKLLPLSKLGARETSPGVIDFGIILPWISANDGNRLWVKVIHEKDQFLQDIQPLMFELTHSIDSDYGDYWSVHINIDSGSKPHPKSAWGSPGRYVYRYYLADLGINCIEVMPVSNVANTVDWGFLPIGYFGVDERFGKRKDLQRFIDAAHQRNIAVILDSVYGHTSESFPYSYIYNKLAYHKNPFMGPFAKDYFGESTDFNREFTRGFFLLLIIIGLNVITLMVFATTAYQIIGIFTAKGIPMIWQGQEFGENYYIPEQGLRRMLMFRPVRWDYFYDPIDKSIISLVRKLIKVRREKLQFRYGEHFFYNHYDHYQSKNILLFSRKYGNSFSLVALNFGDQPQTLPCIFPLNGNYREELHGHSDESLNLKGIIRGAESWFTVPSNYGRIWTLETE